MASDENNKRLLKACRAGDPEKVLQWLEKGADPNTQVQKGEYTHTPLFLACKKKDLETIPILLDHGADPTMRIRHMNTKGETMVHVIAAGCGNVECLQLFLDWVGSERLELDAKNEFDRTPLSIAAELGNVPVLRLLLENGANPNVMDDNGSTPFYWACESADDDEAISLLLDNGADPTVANNRGDTSFHAVCCRGHVETIRFLLEQPGINVNSLSGDQCTPLRLACEGTDNEECIQFLLDQGANLTLTDEDENTPVHIAAMDVNSNYLEILSGHSDFEAVVNTQNAKLETPLILACKYVGYSDRRREKERCIRCLLDNGANPDIQDKNDETPLHILCKQYGNAKLVELLFEFDAEPILEDVRGNTLLHNACLRGDPNCVRVLLDYDVIRNSKNKDGKTPLRVAIERRNKKCARIMKGHLSDLEMSREEEEEEEEPSAKRRRQH